MWFGKNPGSTARPTRSATQHCGVARNGGVLALIAMTRASKSSTLPSGRRADALPVS